MEEPNIGLGQRLGKTKEGVVNDSRGLFHLASCYKFSLCPVATLLESTVPPFFLSFGDLLSKHPVIAAAPRPSSPLTSTALSVLSLCVSCPRPSY